MCVVGSLRGFGEARRKCQRFTIYVTSQPQALTFFVKPMLAVDIRFRTRRPRALNGKGGALDHPASQALHVERVAGMVRMVRHNTQHCRLGSCYDWLQLDWLC
ncbi:unnamed protein product [Prorocentrum cordatum]|uniref:Uncharacterized protein n=1 Tax=Prorocentrum cordatum TaxID=2364126 RepID=A0ABN9T7P3_9DINO|nr:unnamed protein product [Polarella glacialis]